MENVNYWLWEFLKLEVLLVTVALVTVAIAVMFLSGAKKTVLGIKKKFTDGIELARVIRDNTDHSQFLDENKKMQERLEREKDFDKHFDEQEAGRLRNESDQ